MAGGHAMRHRAAPAVIASDDGTVAPMTVAAVAVVATVALLLAGGATALQQGSRARGAADLAALAAARVDRDQRALGWSLGAALAEACAEAEAVAALNGARVEECSRGANASVIVTVSVPASGGARGAMATARAGPSW